LEILAAADPKHLQRILDSISSMVERASTQMLDVRRAFEAQQPEVATRVLHTMRGSVGTLGAKVFAMQTLRAENEIRDGGANVDMLLTSVEQELRKTIEAAQHWLSEKRLGLSTPNLTALSIDDESARMEQFRQYLQQNDLAACDVFDTLKETLSQKISMEAFLLIEKNMSELNFAQAERILSQALLRH
jgi:HPt (histidine-containing phosphotransfer) domain-containing protein